MSLPYLLSQPLGSRKLALLLAICLPASAAPSVAAASGIESLGPLALVVPTNHIVDVTSAGTASPSAGTTSPTASIRIGKSAGSTLKLLPLSVQGSDVVDPEQNEPAAGAESDLADLEDETLDGPLPDAPLHDGEVHDGEVHDGEVHDGEVHDGEVHDGDHAASDLADGDWVVRDRDGQRKLAAGDELSLESLDELPPLESDESQDAADAPSDAEAPLAGADQHSADGSGQPRQIRRLRDAELGPDADWDDHQETRQPAGDTANRPGARSRVGDVDLEPLPAEDATSLEPFDSPAAIALIPQADESLATDNPIQGDQINDQGELLLASGPTAAAQQILPGTARLKPILERTLRYHWQRPEDAAVRTHWGMMHSIMIYDRDTQILNRRQRLNAVAWMAGNNPCRNQTLFTADQHGIAAKTGVGVQGHQAQLLAVFGLVNVPLNYPVYANNTAYTVADLLEREKLDCKSGNELTFTLIALAHYADSDSQWEALDGEIWNVERVIREELTQPIVGAACGGTHRLMGFGHALRRRRAENKAIDGQWLRADTYVNDFINYTWSLQNRDGSMSTAWFEKGDDNGNMDRKIQTTGHMLEFLLTVTPDADLQSPRMIRTVNYLASTMHTERGHEWQVGPKGHALRALAMYYQRVFGGNTPWREEGEARSAQHQPIRTTAPRSAPSTPQRRSVR